MYQRKQAESKQAGVHLVEIDLIRGGPHVLDLPLEILEGLPRWDYLVNLVRRGGSEYQFYPLRLRDPLLRIRLPLNAGDEDATLDLQAAINLAYDIGPYPESLDYQHEPVHPLAADDSAWAVDILRGEGLRN
jgi:hypothetical protein